MYQPKTGARCSCKRGVQRDNCSICEGTGLVIDFALIHAARRSGAVLSYAAPNTGKTDSLGGDIMPEMKKYNHACTLAFEVISHDETGQDLTGPMLRNAIATRLYSLPDEELVEAVGLPYDTYEME